MNGPVGQVYRIKDTGHKGTYIGNNKIKICSGGCGVVDADELIKSLDVNKPISEHLDEILPQSLL